MPTSKLNAFLSTLNLALMFVGYQLATSLFLPVSSDMEGISRSVTVPYRAFALLISLLVIFLNLKKKISKPPLAVIILWLYWIALILRIFYDTNIRVDVRVNDTGQLWFYILGIILPAMFSIMQSYRSIDLDKALKWVYFGTVLTMALSLFNNTSLLLDASEITGRAEGNLALNTISFGHLGTMGIVLSLYLLSKGKTSLIKKILFITVMLLSFLIMMRAGSRSPVLALLVILLFWLFTRGKNLVLGISIVAVLVIFLVIFIEYVLDFMGDISPVMEARLRMSIYEGDTSYRNTLYEEAFHAFLDNPILGQQFALFDNSGGFFYPHNIIIEAFMALGILGGLAMIYILWIAVKKSYFLIKTKDPHFWVCLILIQQIVLSMLGQFYYNQILNVLLVFVLIHANANLRINKKSHYV